MVSRRHGTYPLLRYDGGPCKYLSAISFAARESAVASAALLLHGKRGIKEWPAAFRRTVSLVARS